MITIGRSVRWFNDYKEEVLFSQQNGFDFMQVWFHKGKILIDRADEPKAQYFKKMNFPIIFHAVFDVDDFITFGNQLIDLVKYFDHKEVIIHPVCEDKPITDQTIYELSDNISNLSRIFTDMGVILYIENNSVIDTINYTPHDLKAVFDRNPDIELLLDLAHIDSYEHLQQIIDIKYPKCLHIADKHFSVKHEHLPVGKGDIDFDLIFSKYLFDFDGKVILEITEDDGSVADSKEKILKALPAKNR